jgi:hypothetical protein
MAKITQSQAECARPALARFGIPSGEPAPRWIRGTGAGHPTRALRWLARPGTTTALRHHQRDRETIDSELRLLGAVRRSIREHGGEPSSRQVDELLDERLAHRGRAGEDAAVDS